MIETIIKINVVRKNSVNRLKDFDVMGYVPLPWERRLGVRLCRLTKTFLHLVGQQIIKILNK